LRRIPKCLSLMRLMLTFFLPRLFPAQNTENAAALRTLVLGRTYIFLGRAETVKGKQKWRPGSQPHIHINSCYLCTYNYDN
jgi:hypothetical protein